MFKRLADRFSSAVSSALPSSSSSSSSPIDSLKSMGFAEADARHALQISGGNVEQAAEWLLTNAAPHENMNAVAAQTHDDDLQKALQASLEEAEQTRRGQQPQSAASRKAGEAALSRFDNSSNKSKPQRNNTTKIKAKLVVTSKPAVIDLTTETPKAVPVPSHPKVQVPKRLSEHDKEDQILRCAKRVAPHPQAVDTLLKSLQQLQKNPKNPTFQSIDTSSAAFHRTLSAPGVLDFLKAMNYYPSPISPKALELVMVDPATLYLGVSALEQIQQTSQEYKQNKAILVFDKEIKQELELGDSDMQESIQRSEFLSKCPSEPTHGGGLIQVQCGDTKLSRKFDGDDTLLDIIHWLGSHGSAIPKKLFEGQWFLQDKNHSNAPPYNVTDLQHKTLQYIGCWPSGRLAIVPFKKTIGDDDRMPSSSRGLGAAPMGALHS